MIIDMYLGFLESVDGGVEVEVDVASVGYENSVADMVQALLFKLLELLEKARLRK